MQVAGDGHKVAAQHTHTIFSIAILDGSASDRSHRSHLPVALVSAGEDYSLMEPLVKAVDAEIGQLKKDGIPYVRAYNSLACSLIG